MVCRRIREDLRHFFIGIYKENHYLAFIRINAMKTKYSIKLFISVLFLLPSCGRNENFTFVHMSDPQIGFFDDSETYALSDSLLKDAVDAINVLMPDCVIVTGDLLHDRKNEKQKMVYERRMSEIYPNIPVYITPGNHDIPEFNQQTLSEYLDFIGYEKFSFVLNHCAFIGFDSNRVKTGDRAAEEEQYEWLKSELKKARRQKHIFVFFHCPVAYKDLNEEDGYDNFPMELREKYISLFREFGVDAMFTGHTHTGIDLDLGGVRSVNAGPVALAFDNRASGINVVEVSDRGIECNFHRGKEIIRETD